MSAAVACGATLRSPSWRTEHRRAADQAFAAGMTFNAISLLVGDPYAIGFMTLALAATAVLLWGRTQLAWIALATTVASNPVNLSTSIACNVILASAYVLVNGRQLLRLPRVVFATAMLALLSVVGSVAFWTSGVSPAAVFTQAAATANYLLAPFFLLPALYVGFGELDEPRHLVRCVVMWAFVPTVLLLSAAFLLGTPVSQVAMGSDLYQLFSVYRLLSVDVVLTRTQVGIVLAAIGAASFAVAIGRTTVPWRRVALSCLLVAAALLLVTGSVGSMLALIVGVGAILFKVSQRARLRVVVLACVGGMWLVPRVESLLPAGLHSYLTGRYEQRFAEGHGIGASDRVELWSRAAEHLSNNPAGRGWGLFVEEFGGYPHNEFLTYGIAWGVVCGAAYLMLMVGLWAVLATRAETGGDGCIQALSLAGLGAVTVLLVNSMSDHLSANRWYYNAVWSICWLGYFSWSSKRKGGAAQTAG